MEEKLTTGNDAGTVTADVEQVPPTTEEPTSEGTQVNDMFTQEQVNEIIKNRLAKFYKRYGVLDSQGLDDLVSMAQNYQSMKELYSDIQLQHKSVMEENANLKRDMMFMNNNIDPNRYEEIVALFKGKEMELNEDNFKQELFSHKEWLKPQPSYQTFTVGAKPNDSVPIVDERQEMAKVFGLKSFVK